MDPVSSALKERSDNQEANPGEASKSNSGRGTKTGYLARKFFYHLFRSGPRSTARYISNYMSQK